MIPSARPGRRRLSVAAGTLLLAGCAAPPVDIPTTLGTPSPRPITTRPGRPGFVVAAPHGGSDVDTDTMAADIASRTGFGLVVGVGFQETYERRVLEAAQGPLRFYAEIHGNDRSACAGQIEIGTVGVDRELALRLRTLAELIRDAHLRASRDVQRLDVLVEPADRVPGRSSGVWRDGVLRLPQRALHIELPRCSRREWRETYTAVLADFLMQASALPVGVGR